MHYLLQCKDDLMVGENVDPNNDFLPAHPLKADITRTMDKMLSELESRFPFSGCGIHEYALAHFLDPHFKGYFLKAQRKFEQTKEKLINDHPSTAEFNNPSDIMDVAFVMPDDLDPAEREFLLAQAAPQAPRQYPPIEIEVNAYLLTADPGKDVDVLKWWYEHREQYKLLSKLAM